MICSQPYQGAVSSSPTQFVLGVGKGASGLLKSVVGGVMNSTAEIVSTSSQVSE